MTTRRPNLTEAEHADRRAIDFRDQVRAFRERQPARQRPVSNSDAAYDLCTLCPGGALHAGNTYVRASALLEELARLVEYLGSIPDRGHPMERLEAEPAFRSWFDRHDDTPPPPLPARD